MSNRPNPRPSANARATQQARQGAKRSNLAIWVVGGVLVLTLVAIVVASQLTTSDPVEGQVQDVSVAGTPLSEYSPDGDDPAVGEAAPELDGLTFTGEDITVGGAADQPSLVVFLAHWCPHCQAEVPRLVEWRADGTIPDDIRMVAVATSTDEAQPNYPPQEWLEDEAWPDDILVDSEDGAAATAYGLSSFPYVVAIDADGNVAARGAGELDQQGIEELVAALDEPQ